jgi:hypothetical protein
MKIFRFAGMLAVVLVALGGAPKNAQATGISCWKYCDEIFYSGPCTGTLEQCCSFNRHCPFPYTFMEGNCSDGVNSCP